MSAERITKDTPVTLGMLRALLLAAQQFPGAPDVVIQYRIDDLLDGRLRLNEVTGRLEKAP